jgi:hypothetical protein
MLTEPGSGTRSTDVVVTCTACNHSNVISTAFDRDATEVPRCRGRHPHLRSFDATCDEEAKTLLLGASNTWFGVTRSALAIPIEASSPVDQEVEAAWSDLANPLIVDEKTLEMALNFNPALQKLKGFPLPELWSAIERRRMGSQDGEEALDLKLPEWERFIEPGHAPKNNDFTISSAGVPRAYASTIEQIVAVTRLRETTALVGFARIEAPDSGLAEDAEDASIVPLTTGSPYWAPAADVRGEGIFLQLPEDRVRAWEAGVEKHSRIRALREAIIARHSSKAWLGPRYVLLHSFAHLLINELALECGYGAASLRERIYSDPGDRGSDPMAGILIYTAAADSEGTLGGLVSMAKPETFGRVIATARRRAELWQFGSALC